MGLVPLALAKKGGKITFEICRVPAVPEQQGEGAHLSLGPLEIRPEPKRSHKVHFIRGRRVSQL